MNHYRHAARNMCAKQPSDLHDDNFSWASVQDLTTEDLTVNQVKGVVGSLFKKRLIGQEWNDNSKVYDLYLHDTAIDVCQILFEGGN